MNSQLTGTADTNSKYLKKYEIVCDLGEGYGRYTVAPDEEIMKIIDVANIACGFHGGDYNIMRRMVKLAKKFNVKVGSHPGFPDRMGFGRRKWDISPEEVYNMVIYQTGALKAFLETEGMKLNHIKPHGELYFYVERNKEIMKAVLTAAKNLNVPVVGAKNKDYARMAEQMGVDFIQELYVDIDWTVDGKLVPVAESRTKNPQIIHDTILKAGWTDNITSLDNKTVTLNFGPNPFLLCLHSDFSDALENIKAARKAIDLLNQKK